jgi:hypothetical protein
MNSPIYRYPALVLSRTLGVTQEAPGAQKARLHPCRQPGEAHSSSISLPTPVRFSRPRHLARYTDGIAEAICQDSHALTPAEDAIRRAETRVMPASHSLGLGS